MGSPVSIGDVATMVQFCAALGQAFKEASFEKRELVQEATLLLDSIAASLQSLPASAISQPSIALALENLVGIMEGLRQAVTKVKGTSKFRSTLEHLVGSDKIKNGLKRLDNAKSHLSWAIQFQKEIPQSENDTVLDGEADKFWNTYFHTEVVEYPHFMESLEHASGGVNLKDYDNYFRPVLDWNKDGKVSTVEFKRFLSFFGPLPQSVTLLIDATKKGWFRPDLTSQTAPQELAKAGNPIGLFFARPSTTGIYGVAIDYIDRNGQPTKTFASPVPSPIGVKLQGNTQRYQNLHELLITNHETFGVTLPQGSKEPGGPVSVPTELFSDGIAAILKSRGYSGLQPPARK